MTWPLDMVGEIGRLEGSGIKTAYDDITVSRIVNLARMAQSRFWVAVLLAPGSPITTVTVKLQHRYNDAKGKVVLPWQDLPSILDNPAFTIEIEHTFPVAVGPPGSPPTVGSFAIFGPAALLDVRASVRANAAGVAGDSVVLYALAV
jgi:hypothetical protein